MLAERLPVHHLRCALCHDSLRGVEAQTCLGCGTLLHSDCRSETQVCPTLGCDVEPNLRFAEFMERRDGRLARTAMWTGALLGVAIGATLPVPDAGQGAFWILVASCMRGGMTGFLLGPMVGFLLREVRGGPVVVEAPSCPRCSRPLALSGTFCKGCGYDQQLEP